MRRNITFRVRGAQVGPDADLLSAIVSNLEYDYAWKHENAKTPVPVMDQLPSPGISVAVTSDPELLKFGMTLEIPHDYFDSLPFDVHVGALEMAITNNIRSGMIGTLRMGAMHLAPGRNVTLPISTSMTPGEVANSAALIEAVILLNDTTFSYDGSFDHGGRYPIIHTSVCNGKVWLDPNITVSQKAKAKSTVVNKGMPFEVTSVDLLGGLTPGAPVTLPCILDSLCRKNLVDSNQYGYTVEVGLKRNQSYTLPIDFEISLPDMSIQIDCCVHSKFFELKVDGFYIDSKATQTMKLRFLGGM